MTDSHVEKHQFQAEVSQVLDIVINSLYTDKEIFLRELVSNAADSLEKLRHMQLAASLSSEGEQDLEIRITTDENAGTIAIADSGIGLTRPELVENLGTIAHSGSKAFAKALQAAKQENANTPELIGQFGVGFYSSFMVAAKVEVFTRSYKDGSEALVWRSQGDGAFEIEQVPEASRGAKIVLHLKDDCREFGREFRVKEILRRYSSFVNFPLFLNGERINTVQAIWTRNKADINPEEYAEFYKFQADAFDDPMYTLHFNADAPIALNCLLFAPQNNTERFGLGRMEPGVALYCRRVLIDAHPDKLLPDWMRFVRGVVDSADIPLNISRESMQDSALLKKLSTAVTGRFIKFLGEQATKEPEKYAAFWKQFGIFIKEGITMERAMHERLAKLLRYESSLTKAGEMIGLADYVGRMKDGQDAIYFLYANSRKAVEEGPYLESFKAAGLEVLFLYEPADEFVMSHLGEFEGKKLVSADSADLKLDDVSATAAGEPLAKERMEGLCAWMKGILGERVREVSSSKRLVDSPVAAMNADRMMTPSMRRLMRLMRERDQANELPELQPVNLELNPKHPLIARLDAMRETSPEVASDIAMQLYDNAMMSAGFLENPQEMVRRINKLLEKVGS
jgi:molecular chaperone HtpG